MLKEFRCGLMSCGANFLPIQRCRRLGWRFRSVAPTVTPFVEIWHDGAYGTSSQAGAIELAAVRGVNGRHYPFKKRTYVRYDSGNARTTGAAVGRRAVDAMTTSRIQQRMLRAIEWYQQAFQWRPSPCRFSPTCSHYSHEAISMHGPLRGCGSLFDDC